MRLAYKDRPLTYRQGEDGLWSAIDERLGIGAIARIREEAGDTAFALVFERLKAMSEEEWEAHLAGCEKVFVDAHGREIPGPDDGVAPFS